MQIAVSLYSYYRPWRDGRLSLGGFIREAKRIGADGVELLDFGYRNIDADRAEALDALAETGLPTPIFSVSQNFAKPDEAERRQQLDKVRFGVDEAAHYGASVVRVFAGDVAEGISFEQARHWIVEGLSESSILAAERGVRLALENHGRLAGRSDQVLAIIEEVRARSGSDALWANPDMGNFLLVGQRSEEAIRDVAPLAAMAHLKDFTKASDDYEGWTFGGADGERYAGAVIGEGEVDLASCLEQLRAANFTGWLSIEFEGDEDSFTAVPRSLANARRLLSEVSIA